jgi:hypothetical protein
VGLSYLKKKAPRPQFDTTTNRSHGFQLKKKEGEAEGLSGEPNLYTETDIPLWKNHTDCDAVETQAEGRQGQG